MGILKKAVNEQAFLKAGILGFPGSGKTYTASMLAIAIAKKYGDGKPVAFFDTETGSDFLIPRFEMEGIELLRVKSQALPDLLQAAREAEGACSVLIVDSITHVWRELCESYAKKKKVTRLSFGDWGIIKPIWAEWTNFFLNSRLHIFVCGRAGYEYEEGKDEQGRKEISKVGTKMKVESEFGFEPSLLIEMERADRSAKAGSGWIHRAHILKDRTDRINGMAFDFQKVRKEYKKGDWQAVHKPFAPALDALNFGGAHLGLDTSRTSEELFSGPNGESRRVLDEKRREIVLGEIQGILTFVWPGQDGASKKYKAIAINEVFGCHGWPAVEAMPVIELDHGLAIMQGLAKDLQDNAAPEIEDLRGLIQSHKNRAGEQDGLPESFQ